MTERQIAPGIRALGDSIVNSYLVLETDGVTIVDAGAPSYFGDLLKALAAAGRTLSDVKSVLLTHGHSDHVGYAEKARKAGIPIRIHELDAALARSEIRNPSHLGPVRPIPLLGFLLWGVRHGLLMIPRITEVSTFGDGATLDVPGSPRVIHAPGHTPGSAALHFASHDALFVGDAFCTYSVSTGHRGPALAPFTADEDEALRSLSRLADVPASLVLPGHGEPWRQGPASAAAAVRASVAGV